MHTQDFKHFRDCHKPKWVPVGNYEVFCSGWCIFEDSQLNEVDVFVGIDDTWKDYVMYIPLRFRRFIEDLDKIIVVPTEDGSVGETSLKVVDRLLQSGFRVGFGCYGGHGRTGWLLGRLIREYEGINGLQLVDVVRERLCPLAIESTFQLRDLGVKLEELKEFYPNKGGESGKSKKIEKLDTWGIDL